MVRTHGMTHIALAVQDPKRSFRFYQQVFGTVPVYEDEGSIQAQTPGSHDVLVFEQDAAKAGRANGMCISTFASSSPKTSRMP